MLIDIIGIKSGVALNKHEIIQILENNKRNDQDSIDPWWQEKPDVIISIRAEEVEYNFLSIMNAIGSINDLKTTTELVLDWHRSNFPELMKPKTPEELSILSMKISELQFGLLNENDLPENLKSLAAECRRRFILDDSFPDIRSWDGIISLSDLFKSENIPNATEPGSHFDQRFIDYLSKQENDLEKIHWRQFEYLCAEYFKRKGYQIEITPPRKDGGIDVFARRNDEIIGPELIAIQAKRLSGSNTVKINDVKALWTDATEKNVTKSLITTTTKLEAGARSFCEAKKYRIKAVESHELKNWIKSMSKKEST